MYQISLIAQDVTNNPLSTTVPVTVAVLDINDNPPIFPSPSFAFDISEGTSSLLIMEFTVSG